MKNIATVERIEQEYVVVSTVRKGACAESCTICNSCTVQKFYTNAFCNIDVEIGDRVIIESDTGLILLTMVCVFILPLILPFVLYFLLSGFGTICCVVGAAVGVVFSCIIIYCLSKSNSYIKKIMPNIITITDKK